MVACSLGGSKKLHMASSMSLLENLWARQKLVDQRQHVLEVDNKRWMMLQFEAIARLMWVTTSRSDQETLI